MIFSGSSANLQQGFKVDHNWGGIPAKKPSGEPLVIYCGVIDILQCYKALKKLEHTFKSIIWDGNTVSVHRPSYYSDRFQKFLGSEVFRPAKSNPRNPRIPPAIKEKQRGDSDEDGSGDQDGPKKNRTLEAQSDQVKRNPQTDRPSNIGPSDVKIVLSDEKSKLKSIKFDEFEENDDVLEDHF